MSAGLISRFCSKRRLGRPEILLHDPVWGRQAGHWLKFSTSNHVASVYTSRAHILPPVQGCRAPEQDPLMMSEPRFRYGPGAQTGGKRGKTFVTCDSHVVPHRSTEQAQGCLTSEFGWDPVLSPWYERMMGSDRPAGTGADARDRKVKKPADVGHRTAWRRQRGSIRVD